MIPSKTRCATSTNEETLATKNSISCPLHLQSLLQCRDEVLGQGDGAPTVMAMPSRIKVLRLQSCLGNAWYNIAEEPQSCFVAAVLHGQRVGYLVLFVGVVPCASAATTSSSSIITSFKPLRARSLAWFHDTSAVFCLDRDDPCRAAVQRDLFPYKSLQVLNWLDFSMLSIVGVSYDSATTSSTAAPT